MMSRDVTATGFFTREWKQMEMHLKSRDICRLHMRIPQFDMRLARVEMWKRF